MYFLFHPIFGKSFLLLQELIRKINVRLLLQKYSSDFRTNRIRHERPRSKIGRVKLFILPQFLLLPQFSYQSTALNL